MVNTWENIKSERDLKRYLGRSHAIRAELKAAGRRMEELRSRAESVTPSYSLTPKSPSGGDGKVAHYAIEIVMLQEDIEERATNLLKAEKEIEDLILTIKPSTIRAVLYDYYVNDIPISSTKAEKRTLETIYHYTERYLKYLLYRGRVEILDTINHVISPTESNNI